jgi:two-component system, NarL family, response regulator LiaR
MNMPFRFNAVSKHTLLYGAMLAALSVLVQWLQVRYLIINNATEIYIGAIALVFTALGVWLALKLVKPQHRVETVMVEKELYIEVPVTVAVTNGSFVMNEKVLSKLGISGRELEVLQLMAKGMSNQEIAEALFVSLNTVKTHSCNLFSKLEVNRRIKAVEKARKFGLIS